MKDILSKPFKNIQLSSMFLPKNIKIQLIKLRNEKKNNAYNKTSPQLFNKSIR